MDAFSDALSRDIELTFLNPAEFGEEVELAGQTLVAVVSHTQSVAWEGAEPGLARNIIVVCVSEKAFPHGIIFGATVSFNGQNMVVESVNANMGLVELQLSHECRPNFGGLL